MTSVTDSQLVAASPETVWQLLADLTAATRYGGINEVTVLTETDRGIGASRRCEFDNGKAVIEEVRQWVPGRAITFEIVEAPAPMAGGTVSFELTPQATGGTVVTGIMDIRLRYGAVGKVMAATVGKLMSGRQLRALLDGIRREAEADSVADQSS